MVSELRTLATALEPIEGVAVLRTRWYAETINAPLPAVIVDYERPIESLLLENGRDLPEGDFFYLEIAVKPTTTDDPLETLERLETLIEVVRERIYAAFADKTVLFLQPEVINMPFAKQTSLSFLCDLYIG